MKAFNYKYVVTPDKVIALSTFAGCTVRGIAKCHPNDDFDEEYGKKLAAARCNEKISAKRYARAQSKYNEYVKRIHEMEIEFGDVCDYLRGAYDGWKAAKEELNELSGI